MFGLGGLLSAWNTFANTVNNLYPQHWWTLQSIIDQL